MNSIGPQRGPDESLKRLVRPPERIYWPEDVAAIRQEMAKRGFTASDEDIQWAYSEWCEENYCASWLALIHHEYAAEKVIEMLVTE